MARSCSSCGSSARRWARRSRTMAICTICGGFVTICVVCRGELRMLSCGHGMHARPGAGGVWSLGPPPKSGVPISFTRAGSATCGTDQAWTEDSGCGPVGSSWGSADNLTITN
jgi:hypothetical protein